MRDINSKLGLALAITIGSFALNCSTSHHPGGGSGGGGDGGFAGDGGAIGDARADGSTCCAVVPQTFTTIAQGDLAVSSTTGTATFATPAIDVSQYRELVVGYSVTAGTCLPYSSAIGFQEPGTSLYISTQSLGRVRVDGPTAAVDVTIIPKDGAPCTGTAHYVVAGVGLN